MLAMIGVLDLRRSCQATRLTCIWGITVSQINFLSKGAQQPGHVDAHDARLKLLQRLVYDV